MCVDENIHYRLLKLTYGTEATHYDFHSLLTLCPPCYGIWHPYKYLLQSIWRAYFPLFSFLTHGTLTEGQSIPSKARVRSVEMLFAAVLRVPDATRARLRARLPILHAELGRLRADRVAAIVGEVDQEAMHHQVEEIVRKCVRLERRILDVEAMLRLLEEWAPVAYVVGRTARCYVWEGRGKRSGAMAKEVVMACLVGLLLWLGARAHTVEYVRTMACCLVLWSAWHSAIPAACYSDEVNEACLHQLGRWWNIHK